MAENRTLQIIVTAKNEASKTLKGLDDNLKALEEPLKKVSTVGAVAFGALSVGIGKTVKDASEFESIRVSFERLAQDLGSSGDVMLNKLNEVSKGTISNKDLMLSVNKAVALGVGNNMEDLARLLEIARVKGQALGVDTTQAFNDIVTGIGRGSPLILDNLGIITKGWAEEAKATGQAMDAQFIMNKILADGAVELANVGEVALTPQERMAQLTKQFSDLSATMGNAFMPIVTSVYEAILPIITSFGEWIKNNQELFKNIVLVVGGITAFMAVAYPLIKVVQTAIAVIRALQVITALFNATLLANPITWVIAGIVALIAIIWVLIANWDTVVQAWKTSIEFVMGLFTKIGDWITSVFNKAFSWITSKIENVKTAFKSLGEFISTIFSSIGEGIKGAFKATINFVIDKINWLIRQANKITSALSVVPGVDIPRIPEIPMLAKGGIVNRPTLAMIGEAGAEAVVPLNKKNNPLGSGLTIIVNGDVSGNELVNKVSEAIMGDLRNNTQLAF